MTKAKSFRKNIDRIALFWATTLNFFMSNFFCTELICFYLKDGK